MEKIRPKGIKIIASLLLGYGVLFGIPRLKGLIDGTSIKYYQELPTIKYHFIYTSDHHPQSLTDLISQDVFLAIIQCGFIFFSIGLFANKEWARKATIFITAFYTLYFFYFSKLYALSSLDFTFNCEVLAQFIFFIIIWYYFTRSKIKKEFK